MRAACARVAERASQVEIDRERLLRYAEALPAGAIDAEIAPTLPRIAVQSEALCAFVLTLDAVNFGSGYFPQLHKRAGKSGYRTIEACLIEHFEKQGPVSAAQLAAMTPERCAAIFEQGSASPAVAELMGHFARAWRDLGARVGRRFGGSFAALVEAAAGSAAALVRELVGMPLYRDVARYEGELVPFLKRAQLSVADLARAVPGELGRFRDLDELTLFADNLVPHVLRLDGVLRYAPELVARIERAELIPSGSAEEVEIRAGAIHAVELLADTLRSRGRAVTPRELDFWLWSRGALPRYKERPRHRTRCVYY